MPLEFLTKCNNTKIKKHQPYNSLKRAVAGCFVILSSSHAICKSLEALLEDFLH